MTEETVSATSTISASAETVFAVLADPTQHAAIDGTGWVRDPLDGQRLTGSGQIFRVAMYHPNHPDGSWSETRSVGRVSGMGRAAKNYPRELKDRAMAMVREV